jgi:hypothetical protein
MSRPYSRFRPWAARSASFSSPAAGPGNATSDWSADGKVLAFPDRTSADRLGIFLLSVETPDGITHGNHSGWALALLPVLRSPATHPGGGTVPLHDALHAWLSLVLGVAAIATWRRLARERRLWTWRSEEPRAVPRASASEHRRLWMWVVTLALVGALTAPEVRRAEGVRFPELAAYGAIAFVAYGILLLAAGHRLRRWHWAQLRAARRTPSPART